MILPIQQLTCAFLEHMEHYLWTVGHPVFSFIRDHLYTPE